MTLYFFLTGDAVPNGAPVELPQNWQNISSLDALGPDELAKLGWKRVVDEIPAFDILTQTCRRADWVVHKDHVSAKYQVTDKDLPTLKREAKERVAFNRWRAETGGLGVGGEIIDTSREAQTKLAGAHLLVLRDPQQTIDWKTSTGWIHLKPDRVLELAAAVNLHIQACFTRERVICEAIDAAESASAVRRAEVW